MNFEPRTNPVSGGLPIRRAKALSVYQITGVKLRD
jgi:hypothetical protein